MIKRIFKAPDPERHPNAVESIAQTAGAISTAARHSLKSVLELPFTVTSLTLAAWTNFWGALTMGSEAIRWNIGRLIGGFKGSSGKVAPQGAP